MARRRDQLVPCVDGEELEPCLPVSPAQASASARRMGEKVAGDDRTEEHFVRSWRPSGAGRRRPRATPGRSRRARRHRARPEAGRRPSPRRYGSPRKSRRAPRAYRLGRVDPRRHDVTGPLRAGTGRTSLDRGRRPLVEDAHRLLRSCRRTGSNLLAADHDGPAQLARREPAQLDVRDHAGRQTRRLTNATSATPRHDRVSAAISAAVASSSATVGRSVDVHAADHLERLELVAPRAVARAPVVLVVEREQPAAVALLGRGERLGQRRPERRRCTSPWRRPQAPSPG